METAVLKESEELTQEELVFLYENYEDSSSMSLFKEERATVFLDRVRSVTGLTIKDIVLTKHQEDGETFFQLCFECELEDRVSGSLFYAYRYYEEGMQVKYICYEYDTVKSKLFWEDGAGMTVGYNNRTRNLQIGRLTYYDGALVDVMRGTEKEY